jgi:hypothetical protein
MNIGVIFPSPIYSSLKYKGKDLKKTKHTLPKAIKARGPVSKYPKAREAVERIIPNYKAAPKSVTKDTLIEECFELLEDLNAERKLHAVTGTKLDKAMVDLKEAKARIKELEGAK